MTTLNGSLIAFVVAACGPIYGPPQGSPPAQQSRPTSGPAAPSDPYRTQAESAPPPAPQPLPDPWATRGEDRPPPRADPRPDPKPEPRPTSGLTAEAEAILDSHNRYRADHCAAPLTWSPKLQQVAQAWANSLEEQGCKFGHSGSQWGENLAAGTSGTLDGQAVSAMWYEEITDYDWGRGGFSMQTGHFTQVVWRGTRQIGCGVTTCRGLDVWVCNYDPPGNVERGYAANVKPKGDCK